MMLHFRCFVLVVHAQRYARGLHGQRLRYAFDDCADLSPARGWPLERKVMSGVVPYLDLHVTCRRREAGQEINAADRIAGSDEKTNWRVDFVEPAVGVSGKDDSGECLAV